MWLPAHAGIKVEWVPSKMVSSGNKAADHNSQMIGIEITIRWIARTKKYDDHYGDWNVR